MYVTRRLLRSTIEDATGGKQEPVDTTHATNVFSPRKRRPLLQTQGGRNEKDGGANQQKSNKSNPVARRSNKSKSPSPKQENQGDKRNKSTKRSGTADGHGVGLLIDAHDGKERWCEAKILDLNVTDKSVFIHYVGWNSRYDCWLDAKCIAAHGSHTKVKPVAGSSWNGKDSLFSDGSTPNKPTKASTPTTLSVSTNKKKRRQLDEESTNDKVPTPSSSSKRASKSSSNRTTKVKVEVAVDTGIEEMEQTAKRGSRRSEKIDLELEMDVVGDAKTPTKRTRASPTARASKPPPITTAKSPTTSASRKPTPRGDDIEKDGKTEEDDVPVPTAPGPLQSPTVGMSALRRSARATLAARKSQTKKRKKDDDDDSDEDYKDEEEEEEEEEDDDDEDEVDESDDDMPVRRTSSSNGKARRVSSGSVPRMSSATITQWQTNPAFVDTREHLSMIFRQRLQQRGESMGSFQQAMSESSAASTPRSTQSADATKEDGVKEPKKKKTKTAQPVMSDEEKAAAAQFYYAQHYYQMQAYQQYQQYMYQQALIAQQLERQRLAESTKTDKSDGAAGAEGQDTGEKEEKGGDDEEKAEAPPSATSTSQSTEEPVMNGGIIDPRFIHARMEALEHQKRMQLYYQHYAQATERNLQMLAATPEFLHTGANAWREQVQNSPPLSQKEEEDKHVTKPPSPQDDNAELEAKRPAAEDPPREKTDESRQVENASDLVNDTKSASQTTTPEATPEGVEPVAAAVSATDPASCSTNSPDRPDASSGSPSDHTASPAKTETVLFELAL